MTLGILKENEQEKRVAILPDEVTALKKMNVANILVEDGAGESAFVSNNIYKEAGADILTRSQVISQSDIIIGINPAPITDMEQSQQGAVIINQMQPQVNRDFVSWLQQAGLTSFSMDMIPRTSRAQAMDTLSSMATIAGYRAVLIAAENLPKFFPMFMTAAGSIIPAKVLILGAGVAGLQALATARRLGAVVEVFDVRSAVKEQVESLGGKFIEVEGSAESEDAGGYAVEQNEDFKKLQQQTIHNHAIKADVIITTAQIPGRKAPTLVSKHTVDQMKKGAVIIDLASSTGGNCELTEDNQTILYQGITIIGNSNLASDMPADASKMFGKNVTNFLKLIIKEGELDLNFEDDIVAGTCITHNKEIYSKRLQAIYAES